MVLIIEAIERRGGQHRKHNLQAVDTLARELADWLNGTKRRAEAMAVVTRLLSSLRIKTQWAHEPPFLIWQVDA